MVSDGSKAHRENSLSNECLVNVEEHQLLALIYYRLWTYKSLNHSNTVNRVKCLLWIWHSAGTSWKETEGNLRARRQRTWVSALDLPFTSCVTLGI